MIRRSFLALCSLLALAACGSAPPTPVDHFYRLQPVSLAATSLPPLQVEPLRADSLYAERPLVFSEAGQSRALRQYHYHLWLYPPAQLVQDHLSASLGRTAREGKDGLRLEGRILRFDRVLLGKGVSKAVVALELQVRAGGKLLLDKVYEAEQAAADASIAAHVQAVEQALGNIYGQLAGDLAGDLQREQARAAGRP